MSWLSDIGDSVVGFGKSIIGSISPSLGSIFGGGSKSSGGGNILGGLVSTALTGLALSKLTKSINNSQSAPTTGTVAPDTGVNVQLDPNPQTKIPVCYGTSYFSGILTDAVMSDDNKTMYYVLTLCEQTGIKISDNLQSEIAFQEIFYNDQRIVFRADGVTAQYTVDRNSNEDPNIADLVQVYCYSGSSASSDQVAPMGFTITPTNAWSIIPGWSSSNQMNNLAFAIVVVNYNKDKGTTGLPTMTFKVENSMTMPGDCMYDYMTNTRYGAGIPVEDIFVE